MKFKRPAQTADSACLHPSIVVFVVFVLGAPNGAPCLQLNKNYLWCDLTRAKRVFLHPCLQKKKKEEEGKGHAYVRVASNDRKNLSQNITDENSLAIWQFKKKKKKFVIWYRIRIAKFIIRRCSFGVILDDKMLKLKMKIVFQRIKNWKTRPFGRQGLNLGNLRKSVTIQKVWQNIY